MSPLETFVISERVFLAFDTDGSVTCVQASGWRRAYLLWTFRNFRGLPHKTLNAQQRKLVETLYSEASSNLARELDQERLIGTVEDLRLPRLGPATASAAEQTSNIPLNNPRSGFTAIKKLGERLHAIYARVAFSELPRTVGAWSLVAIMAALAWQQLHSRPAVSASTQTTAVSQDANLHITSAPSVPEPAIASAEESLGQPALRPGVVNSPWLAASLTTTHDASAALSRMQISGPPRTVVYPDFPDKRGKVLLQAVVGSDGKVMQVRLLAGDRLLASAARRAIRQWQYQPLLSDDRRVERETTILVSFISDDVVSVSFPQPAPVSQ